MIATCLILNVCRHIRREGSVQYGSAREARGITRACPQNLYRYGHGRETTRTLMPLLAFDSPLAVRSMKLSAAELASALKLR